MSVAVFVTSETEVNGLIPWAVRFAEAAHDDLVVLYPRRSKGKVAVEPLTLPQEQPTSLQESLWAVLRRQDRERVILRQDVEAGDESTDHDRIVVSVKEILAPDPEAAFVDQLVEFDFDLLVTPVFDPVKGGHPSAREWSERVFSEAPCGVVCIRADAPAADMPLQLLFVSDDDRDEDSRFAIDWAAKLARQAGGRLTLLYVRRPDDVVAREIAEKHASSLAKRVESESLRVERRIGLVEHLVDGLNAQALGEFDLVLVGTRNRKSIRRLLGQLKQAPAEGQVPLAYIRRSRGLEDRLLGRLRDTFRTVVPQIDREERVNLVDRLVENSNFDFDFLALISLSTFIAALGLVLNSTAVVIGAMLVAPLMTPLVAVGLALVQGNERLIRTAVKSVLLGFSVAFGIAALVGSALVLMEPDFTVSREMLSRGSPNLLDLMVALASGIAAAYAMGRPHLLSALPGVAISAALVPPIAVAGLGFANWNWALAGGATLLFLTNIVAIVLGTAITFWAVGINTYVDRTDSNRPPRVWPRYWFFACVVISFVLAIEMSILNPLQPAPDQGGNSEVGTVEKSTDAGRDRAGGD